MFIAKEIQLTGKEIAWSFRVVKIADIIYTTILCCFIVLVTLRFLQSTFFKWIEHVLLTSTSSVMDAPHQLLVFGLFCSLFSLFAVFAYLLRNVIELIPSPFHGMQGLNHFKLREIADISSLVLIIVITQTPMYSKLMNVLMRM